MSNTETKEKFVKMIVKRITSLCILINLIVCCSQFEMKLNSIKSIRRLKPLSANEEPHHKKKCGNLPPSILTDVLGAAYNSRYMSIEKPKHFEDNLEYYNENDGSTKRKSEWDQPFYVDDEFALEISDKPAWEVKHANERTARSVHSIDSKGDDNNNSMTNVTSSRLRRDVRQGGRHKAIERPWECQAKIRWIDLGGDYFPRFLRSVECTKKKCWYNHYVCKPRSFTVKLLRRRNGECVETNHLHRTSNDDLPDDFKELWVWEERAVNFCCDCVVQ